MATSTTQQQKVVPIRPTAAQQQRQSDKKWTPEVMQHGACILPALLLQAQARLAISPQQMNVLLQIVEHWWFAEGQVYPSVRTIAERVGLSTKQVHRHIVELEQHKLLRRIRRMGPTGGRTSNRFDLSGLVNKLRDVAAEASVGKEASRAARRPGGIKAAKATKAT